MELSTPLPSRGAFLRQRADEENRDGVTWTREFTRLTRARLAGVFADAFPEIRTRHAYESAVGEVLARHSEYPNGLVTLSSTVTIHASDFWMPDVLDAAAVALTKFDARPPTASNQWGRPALIDTSAILTAANDALLAGRVAFAFVDRRLRDRSGEPLHSTLITPFETALTGDPRFEAAERAYLQASGELATGHYGASITSAGSALQAALQSLGAKGNDLGALFSDGMRRGFLQGHDARLLDAFKSLGGWVTADRSNRGNAHGPASASRADAQFALHIVAATVLRLTTLHSEPADAALDIRPDVG